MPQYFCIECGRQTTYLNVKEAAEYCEVSRATIYSWLSAGRVHSLVRPSGRAFVCQASLLVPGFEIYQAPGRRRGSNASHSRAEGD